METGAIYRRIAEAFRGKYPNEKPTQKAMQEKLGVGQSDLSRYKTGDRTPTLKQAIDIALKLDVSVEWLLTERGPKFPLREIPEGMEELIEIWIKLPAKVQQEIIGYAKISRAATSTASPDRHTEVESTLKKATERAKAKKPTVKGDS